MRALRLSLIGLFTLTLFTFGCGGGLDQGTASLGRTDEGPAAAQPAPVWARPTGPLIACVIGPCPSFQVRGVNGSPGSWVSEIDLSALYLTPERTAEVQAHLDRYLMVGRYVSAEVNGQET